jgi:hypothetical protein
MTTESQMHYKISSAMAIQQNSDSGRIFSKTEESKSQSVA